MTPARHLLQAGLASVLAVPAVHAAEWSADASAATSGGTDHNPGLRIGGAGTLSSLLFDSKAEVVRRTEISEFDLRPVLRLARYPDEHGLDWDEERLDAGYSLTRERWSLALSASGGRQSTLTSELGTTGRTDINATREDISAGVGPQWLLTERLLAGADLGYQHSAYPGIENTDLYGSSYATGSLYVRYALAPKMSLALSGSTGSFDSQRPDSSSDSRGLTAIFNYAIAERLSLGLSAGPSWVTTRHRTDRGVAYSASLDRTNSLSSLTLSVARAVSPSGYGVLTRRDDLNLAWSGRVTEYTSIDLGLSAIRSKEVLSQLGFNLSDVRYVRANAGVWRQLGEQWSISLSAAVSRQDFYQRDLKASGYEANLMFNWSSRQHVF